MSVRAVEAFLSYAHADHRHVKRLRTHLAAARDWEGIVLDWWDGEIAPGRDWDADIRAALERAELVVFLLTPDLIASDYARRIEVARTFERREQGECEVLPVRVVPVDLQGTPFATVQWVPSGRPVADQRRQDESWVEVVSALRHVAAKRSAG